MFLFIHLISHLFNYSAIFKEIKNQKKNPTYLETQKLSTKQIKCPYCRNIQNGLLQSYPRNYVFTLNYHSEFLTAINLYAL